MDEDADLGEDADSGADADPDSDEHADPPDDADPNEDVDQHGDADPRAIRSLAVTSGDVVAAYEARRRSSRRPVLRATPPFSGRMRARLHDSGPSPASERSPASEGAGVSLDPDTGSLHVPPGRLLDEDAIPSYPDPDQTEDELREDSEIEFSVETHRERHVEAVESWRAAVEDAIVETVEMGLPEGSHVVEVKTLSDSSEG